MDTKFINALKKLLEMDRQEALLLSGKEIAKRYDCTISCANYAFQAFKFIISKK